MKNILLISALLLTACTTTKVLERYDTGEVQMVGHYKKHVLEGESRTYFKNGQLWKLEYYKAGELDGERLYYYEDYVAEHDGTYRPVGEIETRSYYKNGDQVGKEERFYRNGQLQAECYFSAEPTVWREWYENGALRFEGDYVGGRGHGKWTYYYENGKVSKVMTLKEGRQQGEQLDYYPSGQLQCRSVYQFSDTSSDIVERQVWDEQGNEIKMWRIPEENVAQELPVMPEDPHDALMRERGRLQQAFNEAIMSDDTVEIDRAEEAYDLFMTEHEEDFLDFIITTFTEQQRDGEFKEYYATGEVKLITPRSKGETHGVLKVFYKDGSVARSVEYKHNVEDGPVRCFYRNGKPEVEGQMVKGNRTGLWRFYHGDGSLREEMNYDKLK